MKHAYVSKLFALSTIPFLGMVGLLFVLMFHPDMKSGRLPLELIIISYAVVLFFGVLFAIFLIRMPYCVIEYDDRLVEKYIRGEGNTLLFSDIERVEFPFFREKGQDNTRSYRFVMKSGEDVLMYDWYPKMKDFLRRWPEISARLRQAPAAGAGNIYRAGMEDFELKPRLGAYPGFYLMWGAVAMFLLAVWRIITVPDAALGYIVLPIAVLWYHSQALPLNSFAKEGDLLLTGNAWIGKRKVHFELCEVEYITVQDIFVTVKLKDGTAFCIAHKLTERQEEEFWRRIGEMGLGAMNRE